LRSCHKKSARAAGIKISFSEDSPTLAIGQKGDLVMASRHFGQRNVFEWFCAGIPVLEFELWKNISLSDDLTLELMFPCSWKHEADWWRV